MYHFNLKNLHLIKFASSVVVILSSVASLITAASVNPAASVAASATSSQSSAGTNVLSSENSTAMFSEFAKRLRIFADRMESNTALRDDILEASNEMANIHKSLKLPKLSFKSVVDLPKLLMKMPGDALKIGKKVTELFEKHQNEIANILKTDEEIKAENDMPHVHRRFM